MRKIDFVISRRDSEKTAKEFLREFGVSSSLLKKLKNSQNGILINGKSAYIFDRYYRSRSDAGKQGTGLGLSITKAIFQQHGFRFGVHSTVGRGTVFWFIMTDAEEASA